MEYVLLNKLEKSKISKLAWKKKRALELSHEMCYYAEKYKNKLSDMEKRIVQVYLCNPPITQSEAAKIVKYGSSSLYYPICKIIKKCKGLEPLFRTKCKRKTI